MLGEVVDEKLPQGELPQVTLQRTPRFRVSFETVAAIPAEVLGAMAPGGKKPVVNATVIGVFGLLPQDANPAIPHNAKTSNVSAREVGWNIVRRDNVQRNPNRRSIRSGFARIPGLGSDCQRLGEQEESGFI